MQCSTSNEVHTHTHTCTHTHTHAHMHSSLSPYYLNTEGQDLSVSNTAHYELGIGSQKLDCNVFTHSINELCLLSAPIHVYGFTCSHSVFVYCSVSCKHTTTQAMYKICALWMFNIQHPCKTQGACVARTHTKSIGHFIYTQIMMRTWADSSLLTMLGTPHHISCPQLLIFVNFMGLHDKSCHCGARQASDP